MFGNLRSMTENEHEGPPGTETMSFSAGYGEAVTGRRHCSFYRLCLVVILLALLSFGLLLLLLQQLHFGVVSVVVFASLNVVGIVALESVNVENCADRAAVGSGLSFDANVEFAAVGGVSVTGEHPGSVSLSGVRAHETFGNLALVAPVNSIGPNADTLVVIVGQTGGAFVAGRFSVPARVEDAAVVVVREDTVQARAVRRRDRGLKIGPVTALDGEGISAVFAEGVDVFEDETVATQLQNGGAVAASVVLIARLGMREKTEIIGAIIVGVLAHGYSLGRSPHSLLGSSASHT